MYNKEYTCWRLRSGRLLGKIWLRLILRLNNKSKWKYGGELEHRFKRNLKNGLTRT